MDDIDNKNDSLENEISDDESIQDPPPPPPQELSDSDDDSIVSGDDDSLAQPQNDDDDDDDNDDNDDEDDDEQSVNIQSNNIQSINNFIDSDDDISDDDDDENYLQKFDNSISQNVIEDFHPELKQLNYEEVKAFTNVVRDNNGTIIDPLHKSLPFITKYEKAKILGERARQISAGATPMVDIEENVIDDYLIALKEFEQKKIPFIIKRPMPNGGCEYWKFEDLEILV
jgi:DNA-directed RNA polymerases I, II, and III subunit RPABC2